MANNGIFVMPTISEQIGPDLQALGGAIAKFRNPNRDIQTQLRQAVAQNPELLQKLIDLGPDKVGMLFGKEAAFLGQGEKSVDEQMKQAVTDLFKTDPIFKEELIAGKTGTQTKKQRQKEDLGITGLELGNRAAESQVNVAEATEDAQIQGFLDNQKMIHQKVTDMQEIVNKIPNIGAIDINKAAFDAFRGRGDAATMARLQQAGIDIGPLVNSLQQQSQIAAQFSLEKMRQQSKSTQVMALAPLEKLADDNRNMVNQYNDVIKGLQKDVSFARTFISKPRPADAGQAAMWDAKKAIVDQFDTAIAGRDKALRDYNMYDDKRKQLVGVIYGVGQPAPVQKGKDFQDTTGVGGGSSEIPPRPSEIAPPSFAPAVAQLEKMNPQDRAKAVAEVKEKAPEMYNAMSPYIGAIDVIESPKKSVTAQGLFEGTRKATSGGNGGLTASDYAKAGAKISKAIGMALPKVVKILKDYGNNRLEASRDANRVVEYLQMNPDSLPTISDVNVPNPGASVLEFLQSREGNNAPGIRPTNRTSIGFGQK